MSSPKNLLAALLLLPSAICSQAQNVSCFADPSNTGSTNQTYSPSTMVLGKTTTTPRYRIHFSHSSDGGNTFYVDHQSEIDACINTAGAIISHMLVSMDPDMTLNIHLNFQNSLSGTMLMGTTDVFHHDFVGTGASVSSGLASTNYCQALANYLWDQNNGWNAPNHFTGDDFQIDINTSASWNFDMYNTCPSAQYDFLSILTHEIFHGLGFYSNVEKDMSTSEISYSPDEIPAIYDRFMVTIAQFG